MKFKFKLHREINQKLYEKKLVVIYGTPVGSLYNR